MVKNGKEKSKLVIIKSTGPIYELGGISGPVTTPSLISMNKLVQMLNSHKVVFEVNPNNPKEMVRLTYSNLTTENFKAPKANKVNIRNEGNKSETSKTEQPKVENKKEEKKQPEGDFVKQQ